MIILIDRREVFKFYIYLWFKKVLENNKKLLCIIEFWWKKNVVKKKCMFENER